MNVAAPSMADPPFACPPDTVIDVTVPPSVNRTRKVHWKGQKKIQAWKKNADMTLIASGQFRKAQKGIGRYELTIILNEDLCRADPDNVLKVPIDYLRALGILTNDSPRYARRTVIEWGDAPLGMRLIIKPLGDCKPAEKTLGLADVNAHQGVRS